MWTQWRAGHWDKLLFPQFLKAEGSSKNESVPPSIQRSKLQLIQSPNGAHVDVYEPPAGVLALISGPRLQQGENSNSKALALGHQALSGGGARRQPVPVIIPLFGGTHSVLIRCKGAAKQYLVAPQIRIRKQVAHAAAAGCERNEIMNYQGTRSCCQPGASCTQVPLVGGRGGCGRGKVPPCGKDPRHWSSPSRCQGAIPPPPTPLQPPPLHWGEECLFKMWLLHARTPPKQKHAAGCLIPLKGVIGGIISSPPPPPLHHTHDSERAISIPMMICWSTRKKQETVETKWTPAQNCNWVAPVSFACCLGN